MRNVVFVIFALVSFSVFAENERFKLYTFPEYVNRSILLDTKTGKMWTDKCLRVDDKGECLLSAWTVDRVEGINGSKAEFRKDADLLFGEKSSFNPDSYLKDKVGQASK